MGKTEKSANSEKHQKGMQNLKKEILMSKQKEISFVGKKRMKNIQ